MKSWMCIGFPSLLEAKILGTRKGRRNDPLHRSAKTSTPPLPVILHCDYLIDAWTNNSHPAQNGAHTHFKQTIPWCLVLSVTQNNNCKTQQWNFPLGTAVPQVLCASLLWVWQGGKRLPVLLQGYYSSSSFPPPFLPFIFQSCSSAIAVDEALETTKSCMAFHKSHVFSSLTLAGHSALSVWQQIFLCWRTSYFSRWGNWCHHDLWPSVSGESLRIIKVV